MSLYQEFKYQASDAICAQIGPLGSELFSNACPRFADGFFVTIELLFLSSVIGFIIAVFAAAARTSPKSNAVLGKLAFVYTYIFRGTPLLVQLWIVYFGIGSLGEAGLGPFLWTFFKDAWMVGLLVLTLNTGAYVAEILRGGLVNIPRGEVEAAVAIGMTRFQMMRRILLPQAIRIAWPAYGNELILLMKASALVSTITVMDLMGQTRTLFSRSYNLDVYLYAAVLYLVLAGLISLGISLMERRFRR